MANVLFTENGKFQFRESVNTPDFEGKEGLIINPDISNVKNIPIHYWKFNDKEELVSMSAAEIAVVDAQEKEDRNNEREQKANNLEAEGDLQFRALSAILEQKGFVTKDEFVTKIKELING